MHENHFTTHQNIFGHNPGHKNLTQKRLHKINLAQKISDLHVATVSEIDSKPK